MQKKALLEVDCQQVCGLQFTEFSPESFGWWSCEMRQEETENSAFNKGTFKINKPDEWPTDIRLPTDIEVNHKRKDNMLFIFYPRLFYTPNSNKTILTPHIAGWTRILLYQGRFTLLQARLYKVSKSTILHS